MTPKPESQAHSVQLLADIVIPVLIDTAVVSFVQLARGGSHCHISSCGRETSAFYHRHRRSSQSCSGVCLGCRTLVGRHVSTMVRPVALVVTVHNGAVILFSMARAITFSASLVTSVTTQQCSHLREQGKRE